MTFIHSLKKSEIILIVNNINWMKLLINLSDLIHNTYYQIFNYQINVDNP